MAVTENLYTGDNSTVLFSFTFPYLQESDVKVSLNGTLTTAYSLANATTVQFNTAPASGVAIRIYRDTANETPRAAFYSGSVIRAQDLNNNFDQVLYVTQESDNEAAAATSIANAATATANTALSNSTAAVATANTAETNSLTAISTANTAESNSTAAVATANTASTTAASAVTTANSAVTTANNAVTTANSAVTTANNAVNTANTANTTATNAESIANSALDIVAGTVQFVPYADVASIPGSPSDGDAIQVVDSTGIESFTPLTGLPAGFVGTPQLFVRLQYDATGVTWTYVGYGANDPDNRYVIQGVTGSATNPSFYFDPNTGVYSPGEDELALSTGGSARLTIDSTGSVSIPGTLGVTGAITGSLTGAASLNVLKAGDTMTGNLTAPAFIPNGSTVPTNGLYLPATNSVALSTNGTGRLFVDASGNVGINTASILSPVGYGYARQFGITANTSGDSSVSLNLQGSRTVDGAFADINFWHQSTSNRCWIAARREGTDADVNLAFGTKNNERLRITSAGLVGIGTSSPSNTLHVVGAAATIGRFAFSSNITAVGNGGAHLRIQNTDSTSGNQSAIFFANSNDFGAAGVIAIHTPSTNAGQLALGTRSNSGYVEAIRIDSSQRVGIGTTSPASILHCASTGDNNIRVVANGATAQFGVDVGVPFVGTNNGPFNFYSNGQIRATLDSSGRLLVGTSSSTAIGSGAAASVQVATNASSIHQSWIDYSNGNNPCRIVLGKSVSGSIGTVGAGIPANYDLGEIRFAGSNGTDLTGIGATISAENDSGAAWGSGDTPGRLVFSTTADGASSPTERMRISSDGRFNVGEANVPTIEAHRIVANSANESTGAFRASNANSAAAAPVASFDTATNSTATSNVLIRFGINSFGSGSGQINANGAGACAFGTFSDQRLKENIVDLQSQWENIKNLRPVEFDFIESEGGEHQIGFIAQEFETVYPDAVGSSPVFTGLDQPAGEERLTLTGWSKTEARLVKALQEAMERIETLEAKVAALESA